MEKLLQKLEDRKRQNNFRTLPVKAGLIDFFSNDYLGLAESKELFNLIHSEHDKINGKLNGSTGSRLLSGNNEYFAITERRLANIFNSESALLFNSGYNANVSLLSSVPQKGDTIIYDELIHASLKEGARLSFAKRFSFEHNNVDDLEQKIKKAEGICYVVVESVYSMDGDFSPLEKIVEVCEKYNAFLILDEAHSTGIWGKAGSGLACELNLEKRIFARVYTFGKAMGIHGACIAGSEVLIDFLINFARPFIYTTAMTPHGVASINGAFTYIENNASLKNQLVDKIVWFKKEVSQFDRIKNKIIESESAIQVLNIPGNKEAKSLAERLNNNGFDVKAILSPTVKDGEERLRICLHVYNTNEEITNLVKNINQFLS